jgi:Leucine rich repeat variant
MAQEPKVQPSGDPREVAALEVGKLMKESKAEAMFKLVKDWRAQKPPAVRRRLILELIRLMPSPKKLELTGPPQVIIGYEMPKNAKDVVVECYDVYREGGRAAWAIQQLLECPIFPQITAKDSQEQQRKTLQEAYEIVIGHMILPPSEADITPTTSEKERIRLAGMRRATPSLLTRLAQDKSPAVRLAVARNLSTPLEVIDTLRKDPDARVSAAAKDNFRHARGLNPIPD